MKLCKDCKFFHDGYAHMPARCQKEKHLVYGGARWECNTARYKDELCGEGGAWFEQGEPKPEKKTFLERLFQV